MNPLAAFDSFEEGVQSVVFVGDEDVDGEQLGHYKVKVDTSKIDQFKALQGQAQLPETVSYDLWLDDQNRMGKMTMEMDMGSAPVTMEVAFTDWGEPVDIAAPRGQRDRRAAAGLTPAWAGRPVEVSAGRASGRAAPSCWSGPAPSAWGCWSGWRRAP